MRRAPKQTERGIASLTFDLRPARRLIGLRTAVCTECAEKFVQNKEEIPQDFLFD